MATLKDKQTEINDLADIADECENRAIEMRQTISQLPEGHPVRTEMEEELETQRRMRADAELKIRLLRKEIDRMEPSSPDREDDWYLGGSEERHR